MTGHLVSPEMIHSNRIHIQLVSGHMEKVQIKEGIEIQGVVEDITFESDTYPVMTTEPFSISLKIQEEVKGLQIYDFSPIYKLTFRNQLYNKPKPPNNSS